ncbi:uncharacterized protein [Blastocystis hominis]|uniref:Uncharacterized protein n=1 Tax=Blastocystis hominis TaxID=12968 RepID=D8M0Y9_BLAHO|nr:uncharacterized protein [Blastocystis hominis]CBK21728.2 unnamed protein product [Blastocystis hominis]|eukprot:XP_012895776.1 uncharacterized protein [Blastocystis hominis]
MRRILEAEAEERAKNASSLQQTGETGETRESPKPEESTKASETAEGSETLSISAGMNYKDVWMKSNRAAVERELGVYAVGAEGERVDRSLFQFATIEEVNALTLLDLVVVSDLSKAWSELGQLANSTHHAVRSFNLTVANDRRNIRFPCLLTMGNVMDMNGYYCQIAVTFTPLQLVGASGMEECDAIGGHCAGLEKLV